jgi:Tfp pilus assembly protein PilO
LRDDTAIGTTSGAAGNVRARFDTFRNRRQRSALGLAEFVALAAASLLLLAAVFAYFFLLVPQRSRMQSLETQQDELRRLLKTTEGVIGERTDTQQQVGEILTSLDNFEIEHLGQLSSARATVYEELNRLILKNNLRISGGITYTQLQEAVPGADAARPQQRTTGDESAARVVQSVFPGIGVTLTVEGTYASLRHFIRDIEADRQFVVVNAVELEGVADSNAAAASAAAVAPLSPEADGKPVQAPTTPSRNALVSLRLDMAAYFRRSGAGTATQ